MKILTPSLRGSGKATTKQSTNTESKIMDCHATATALARNDDYIQFRFIYYAMKCIYYSTTEHARQWIGKYSNFQIPLPPLEVQNEIVEILDKFDTLTDDLTSGIPAEIEARKKQYEYYRERLLTFKEK